MSLAVTRRAYSDEVPRVVIAFVVINMVNLESLAFALFLAAYLAGVIVPGSDGMA